MYVFINIDDAFDDEAFAKMDPDSAIDAAYAKRIPTYTVTFDGNGHGTPVDAQIIPWDSLVDKPVDLSESGYENVAVGKKDTDITITQGRSMRESLTKIYKSRCIPYLALFFYILINLVLIWTHEPWGDEAQSWLIARDNPISELFLRTSVEGHTVLWWLILAPFAKLGFPYITANIVSLFFMTVTVWLVLFKSPFPMVLKLVIIYSPLSVYHLSVFSRQYCLFALIASILAILYPKRLEKPGLYGVALALLVQIHIHFIGFAFILSLLWLVDLWGIKEQKRCMGCLPQKVLYCLFPFLSAVFLIVQVRQRPGLHSFSSATNWINTITIAYLVIWLLLWCLVAAYVYRLNKKTTVFDVFISVSFSFFFLVYFTKYVFTVLHTYSRVSWLWIIVFGLWILAAEYFQNSAFFLSVLMVAGLFVFYVYSWEITTDLRRPYSGAEEMAEFLEDEVNSSETDCFIILNAENRLRIVSIIPYLHKWTPLNAYGENISFVKFEIVREPAELDDIEEWAHTKFPNSNGIYIMSDIVTFENNKAEILERAEILKSQEEEWVMFDEERYVLYYLRFSVNFLDN